VPEYLERLTLLEAAVFSRSSALGGSDFRTPTVPFPQVCSFFCQKNPASERKKKFPFFAAGMIFPPFPAKNPLEIAQSSPLIRRTRVFGFPVDPKLLHVSGPKTRSPARVSTEQNGTPIENMRGPSNHRKFIHLGANGPSFRFRPLWVDNSVFFPDYVYKSIPMPTHGL